MIWFGFTFSGVAPCTQIRSCVHMASEKHLQIPPFYFDFPKFSGGEPSAFGARRTETPLLLPPIILYKLSAYTSFQPSYATDIIVRRAGLLWSQEDFEWRWSVPLFKCLTVLEFSFILFDLCLLITFFNFIMNYVPIVTFWIFTYHKIWILSIMFCSIWSYWIIYFLACLEVSWRVVS